MIKLYNCFSLRMSGYLMFRGFVPLDFKDDQKSKRKVFVFKDSEELQKAIEDYKNI